MWLDMVIRIECCTCVQAFSEDAQDSGRAHAQVRGARVLPSPARRALTTLTTVQAADGNFVFGAAGSDALLRSGSDAFQALLARLESGCCAPLPVQQAADAAFGSGAGTLEVQTPGTNTAWAHVPASATALPYAQGAFGAPALGSEARLLGGLAAAAFQPALHLESFAASPSPQVMQPGMQGCPLHLWNLARTGVVHVVDRGSVEGERVPQLQRGIAASWCHCLRGLPMPSGPNPPSYMHPHKRQAPPPPPTPPTRSPTPTRPPTPACSIV
jgi:hypothetical protein